MTNLKITFYAFATYVSDLSESISYYEKLGYNNPDIADNGEYMYALMEVPGGNGACVELRESLRFDSNAGKTATVFAVDLSDEADDTQWERLIFETIEDLVLRGFTFHDMTPKNYNKVWILDSIQMADPQGAIIEYLFHA